jgi:hypothetical protein
MSNTKKSDKRPTKFEQDCARALYRAMSHDEGGISYEVLPLLLASFREELINHFGYDGNTISIPVIRAGRSPKYVAGSIP